MATITIAALCSGVAFRTGLLSVLEAGLERFEPDGYPTIIAPYLVLRVDWNTDDFNNAHTLRALVEHTDGEQLADVAWAVTYRPPDDADAALTFYSVIQHQLAIQVRRDGIYTVRVTLDGHLVRTLPFRFVARLPQA